MPQHVLAHISGVHAPTTSRDQYCIGYIYAFSVSQCSATLQFEERIYIHQSEIQQNVIIYINNIFEVAQKSKKVSERPPIYLFIYLFVQIIIGRSIMKHNSSENSNNIKLG